MYVFLLHFYLTVCVCPILGELAYRYAVDTLADEFIITYHHQIAYTTRVLKLNSILKPLYLNYSIQPRWHSTLIGPTSNFDVLFVYNLSLAHTEHFTTSVTRSCFVKSVSSQKRIQRQLLYSDISNVFFYPDNHARRLNLFGKSWKKPVTPGTTPLHPTKQPWRLLKTDELWAQGLCGEGVRVGLFDTGLVDTTGHPHFEHARVRERTDWTRPSMSGSKNKHGSSVEAVDGHGHGTFVLSLLAATRPQWSLKRSLFYKASSGAIFDHSNCPPLGMAPMADLYVFRVFTDDQVSYTSWFLDAFNYAIARKLHVINLSVGGPDFLDQPYVDKVFELSANGILLVSAIGNDGPLFGTLNNPADQMDVLGVGGVDALGRVAQFSSRGMTTWNLFTGYGQVKPDVVTFSTGVIGSALDGQCRTLSGTSVASPVVAGMVALLVNAALNRNALMAINTTSNTQVIPINPASIKQALIAAATPLNRVHVFGTEPIQWPSTPEASTMFEQGAGLVDLIATHKIMTRLKPQASLVPSYLDFTQCPYMWPYCSQPMYYSMQPIVVNITILNSMGVVGRIANSPVYHPYTNRNGRRLHVGFTYSSYLWPWSGHMALHLSIQSLSNETLHSSRFSGLVEGFVTLVVESTDDVNKKTLTTELVLPIRVQVIPTPIRSRRILYDQFHTIRYPSGYIPRDDLTRTNEPLDWLGDHMHTNLRDLYMHLRKANYYVEILTAPYSCFDASNYGSLLIFDPEEEFFPSELDKLYVDVLNLGLSLLIFAEWYNTSVLSTLSFFDTNTQRVWTPETGGANLPALNNLLNRFDAELGDTVYTGNFKIGGRTVSYTSGSSLRYFPRANIGPVYGRGNLLRPRLVDFGAQVIRTANSSSKTESWRTVPTGSDPTPPILGIWTPTDSASHSGRLVVYGDSDCLTSTHLSTNCFWLLDALLLFATSSYGRIPLVLAQQMSPVPVSLNTDTETVLDHWARKPIRPKNSQLHTMSKVVRKDKKVEAYTNGTLPPEAYQALPICPVVKAGPISAAVSSPSEKLTYEPQPLKLYPPVAKSSANIVSQCHMSYLSIHNSSSSRNQAKQVRANWVSDHSIDFIILYAFAIFIFYLVWRRLASGLHFARLYPHNLSPLALMRRCMEWRRRPRNVQSPISLRYAFEP